MLLNHHVNGEFMSIKVKKRQFRTAYDPPVRVGYATVGESRTDPIFHEDLKIQNMIKRYDTAGYLQTTNRHPQYTDFTNVNDLHTAMETVKNAEEDFQKVPSYIRERFDNDPKQFFEFAKDPDNHQELMEYGLAENPLNMQKQTAEESQPIVEKTQEPSKEGS